MLHETIANFARVSPRKISIIDRSGTVTWQELNELTNEYSSQLKDRIGSLQTIVLPAENRDGVALLAACSQLKANIIVIPGSEKPQIIAQKASELHVAQCARILDGQVCLEDLPGNSSLNKTLEPNGLITLYTSGSSGSPKGVTHTWATLSAGIKIRPDFNDGRWILAYPLGSFASLQVLTQCMWNGGVLAFCDRSNYLKMIQVIIENQISYLSCTPTYIRQLILSSEFSAWKAMQIRHITLGGEIVSQNLLDEIRMLLPSAKITQIYGSTEIGTVIRVTDCLEGFDLSQIDQRNFKIEDGELYVRRSSKSMLSYLGHGEETKYDWMKTGDIVQIRGCRVVFLGRKSGAINVGGQKIEPALVESVLREVPGILALKITGHKSSLAGNLVKAIIWINAEVKEEEIISKIDNISRTKLSDTMRPRVFEFHRNAQMADNFKLRLEQPEHE